MASLSPQVAAATAVPTSAADAKLFTTPGYRRPLHWVFKVGDLQATLEFYERALGMKVHRHEEFASGCEATCNGPYGGAWSKTMIGYGTEEANFALELTYNYGISSYEKGNDLRYIAVSRSAVRDASGSVRDAAGREFLVSPDGYRFLLVDAPPTSGNEPFLYVSLNVSDLARSRAFYTATLGATERPSKGVACEPAAKSLMLGWGLPDAVTVELVQLPAGTKVDRASAPGRFATETEDGAPERIGAAVKAAGEAAGSVLHGPLVLQPHGEEVVIVQDADGQEYCFVDARGYRNCINVTRRAGGNIVDWPYRKRLAAAAALTGEAAKGAVVKVLAGDYDEVAMSARLDALIASSPVVLFSQTTCPYCKKAKALLAEVGSKRTQVVELDALGAEGHALRVELGKRTGRSSVPSIFIGGASVGGFSDGPGVNTLQSEGKLVGMLQSAGAM